MSADINGVREVQKPEKAETMPDTVLHDLLQRGYRFAFSLTHEVAAAEDLIQDAWLGIHKTKGPWNTAYLLATIRNRFVDQCRRNRLVVFEPLDEIHENEIGSDSDTWSDDFKVSIHTTVLTKALDRLNPNERSVLYLSVAEGYSAQEIADLLDKSRGTILSMVFRAKKKLRKFLKLNEGMAS